MKIAVVGAGKLGEKHAQVYRSMSEVTLVGVADVDRARATHVCGALGADVRPFDSIDAVIESPDVDAVDICTPTPLHFDQVAAALRAGKHVFCEKPLTATLAEAEALRDVAESARGTLRVGYIYRFHPRVARLKDRMDDGALGTVASAVLRIGGRGSHREWKHRRDSGGGAVLDMATHMFDLAVWLFGPFAEIEPLHVALLMPNRTIGGTTVEVDAEDLVVARLRSQSGVETIVHADFITLGFSNSIEVSGTNGSAFVSILSSLPDRYALHEPRGDLPSGETVTPGADADMLRLELQAFVADAACGTDSSDIHASVEVARAAEAMKTKVAARAV